MKNAAPSGILAAFVKEIRTDRRRMIIAMSTLLTYSVIRSNRKTMSLEVRPNGEVVVRAPLRMPKTEIQRFVQSKSSWLKKHLQAAAKRQEEMLTIEDIRMLAQEAARVIPQRVRYYAPKVGVTFGKITIRNQKTRWGSCSSRGNLNFNCLLMLTPPEVIDSVVVHELCHRKEMNHSARFYEEVYRVFPEYDKWNRWLKENGGRIMARMTGEGIS